MSLLCLRHRLLRSTRLSRLVVLFIRVDESRENSLTKNLPVPVIPLDREAKGSRGDSPPTLAATLHALLQLLPVHAIAPHLATFALIQQLLVLTHAILPQLFARAAVVPDLVVHAYARAIAFFADVSTTPVGADTGAPALLAVLTVPSVLADARPTAFLAYVPPPPVLADPFPRTLNAVIPVLGFAVRTQSANPRRRRRAARETRRSQHPREQRGRRRRGRRRRWRRRRCPAGLARRVWHQTLPIRASRPNAERAQARPGVAVDVEGTHQGTRTVLSTFQLLFLKGRLFLPAAVL